MSGCLLRMVMWPTQMLWDAVDASLSGTYVADLVQMIMCRAIYNLTAICCHSCVRALAILIFACIMCYPITLTPSLFTPSLLENVLFLLHLSYFNFFFYDV